MSDLAAPYRQILTEQYQLQRPSIVQDLPSHDGTRKWLLRLNDGAEIEMVYIPESKRGTLCVSSQVGCSLTCSFCHTGTQRMVRNLTCGEIIGQVLLARDLLDDWTELESRRKLTNLVFMGMGEPLLNPKEVAAACHLLTNGEGLGFSRRRVTVSTSGVVPPLVAFGEETRVALAVSLHAVSDELRDKLVPINRKYKLASLMDAIKQWPGLDKARRVTFEYIMLNEINDYTHDAKNLIKLIAAIPCKINLIPFNPWPGSEFSPSTPERLEQFAAIVRKAGYTVTVRRQRGDDILAACGQLKSASLRLSATERAELDKLRQEKEQLMALN